MHRAKVEMDLAQAESLIEALATELLERKALDLVLQNATYEDYEMNPSEDEAGEVATVAAQAVPGGEAAAEPPPEANG